MTVPDVAVSGFVVNRQYVRMEAPEDSGFAGFWADVRQNLTNGERRMLIDALNEITERETAALDAIRAEMQALSDAADAGEDRRALNAQSVPLLSRFDAEREQYQREAWLLITPHIRSWNAVLMDGDVVTPIPAPADGGMASIEAITSDMAEWLCQRVLVAYRSGKGVSSSLKKPGGSPPPGGGPKLSSGKANGQVSPTRRKSSPSLSASAFQA